MKRYFALAAIGLILVLLGLTNKVQAHDPHVCPDEFPDEPAIKYGHLEQSQIDGGEVNFETVIKVGQEWFDAVLNYCDGQGRPATTGGGAKRSPIEQPTFLRTSAPDSSACAGCHNQPRSGGGGDFVANVFVLAQTLDPVIETVDSDFSNERNTLGMFGSGAIEMLARELTAELHTIQSAAIEEARQSGEDVTRELVAKGISYGSITAGPDGSVDTTAVEGIDADLIIKPFHQAGVVVSLREFTVNAFNHHHGLQAEERFDLQPEKSDDFDEDGHTREMTIGDVTAVTLYQASLGVPGQVLPEDDVEQDGIELGEEKFNEIGCAGCHVPELNLDSQLFTEPNPYNPDGTWAATSQQLFFNMTREGQGPYLEAAGEGAIVRAYTDLKRHNLCDPPNHPDPVRHFCNEQLAQNRPDQNGRPGTEYFLTRKLWDAGSSAPYGHRGDLPTITEAIWAHGGEARLSYEAFKALPSEEQAALVNFLKTLQVLPAGSDQLPDEDTSDRLGSSTIFLGTAVVFGLAAFGFLLIWISYRRKKSMPADNL